MSLLNLEYKIYVTIHKNRIQKALDGIIEESKSAAIKKKLYYTHCLPYVS